MRPCPADSRRLEMPGVWVIEPMTRAADCLHAGQCGSAGRAPMITFDETAARLPSVELLKT